MNPLTRVGAAVAAVMFALTAIAGSVALPREAVGQAAPPPRAPLPPPPAPPPPPPPPAPPPPPQVYTVVNAAGFNLAVNVMDWFVHNIPQRMERLAIGWGGSDYLNQYADGTNGLLARGPMRMSFLERRATTGTRPGAGHLDPGGAPREGWAVWGLGVGTFGDVNNTGPVSGYDFRLAGGVVGVEYRAYDWLLGLHVGYADGRADLDNESSRLSSRALLAGFHGGARWYSGWLGPVYFDGTATFGHVWQEARQSLVPFGGAGSVSADYSSTVVSAYAEFGMTRAFGDVGIQPYTALRIVAFWDEAFAVTAPGFAPVGVADSFSLSVRTYLGARGWWRVKLGTTASLVLKLRAAWVAEIADNRQQVTLNGFGRVNSASTDRHMLLAGASAHVDLGSGIRLLFDYTALLGSRQRVHAFWGAIRFSW